jgi:hypothetical protein
MQCTETSNMVLVNVPLRENNTIFPFHCITRLVVLLVVGSIISIILRVPTATGAQDTTSSNDPREDSSPWGVASGAEWFSEFPRFNPLLKAAGVRWLRGFYEWQTIQPKRGYFNWILTDRLLANAKANDIHLTYTFAYFAPWASADGGTRKFPIKDIQFWRDYVSSLVSRYHKDIKYWEIWNEFNGSFAENGTPQMYAELVREASIEAKKIDPTAKIGMSVANFDVNFLDAVIKAGAAGHFDYICVHPYEKLSALEDNGEIDFLAMASTLREMLAKNSQPVNAPLWITEIGAQAPTFPDQQADQRQAILVAKAFLLSIASGFQRVFWFEARGPSYGNHTDHGLIRADFTLRPSYQAMKTMNDVLGAEPESLGWLNLGNGGYGFMFNGNGQSVLAAWAPAKQTVKVKFDNDSVRISDLSGVRKLLPAGQTLTLTDAPQLLLNVPPRLIEQAKANKHKPFPWGGDYSQSQRVTSRLQVDNLDNGLHQVNPDTTLTVLGGGQSWRRTNFARPDGEGHYIYFSVAPQFAPVGTRDLEITAAVRRLAPEKDSGMSLTYESQRGYVDAGYIRIPEDDQWHELKWKITDANFVSKWGWNFRLSAIASPGEFLIKEVSVGRTAPR